MTFVEPIIPIIDQFIIIMINFIDLVMNLFTIR